MDVIDAGQIENTHTLSIDEAVQQVPGVTILDDQASIRGGNGYSYGVGSRVLLMLDELPFLTGASSEAKWNFLPIENISSMEVIKGASSALYGKLCPQRGYQHSNCLPQRKTRDRAYPLQWNLWKSFTA